MDTEAAVKSFLLEPSIIGTARKLFGMTEMSGMNATDTFRHLTMALQGKETPITFFFEAKELVKAFQSRAISVQTTKI
jgi:hypothetical protein